MTTSSQKRRRQRRRRRQLWLVPPAFLTGLVFLLPYFTCHFLPEETNKLRLQDARESANSSPDATLNGIPLVFKQNVEQYSSIHCIGETFLPSKEYPWIYRSCHYQHFCFDVLENDYVLFQSPQDAQLDATLSKNKMVHVSSVVSKQSKAHSVSIGGINTKWTWKSGIPRLDWTPRVIQTQFPPSFYEMNSTMIPFHSLAGFNPGHFVWDDLLPIYTLLKMFGIDPSSPLLLLRYILPGRGMWASCDFNERNKQRCETVFGKFLPLFGINNTTVFTTNQDFRLEEKIPNRTRYVCAKNGLAGIGMLTDHGIKTHGWDEDDYKYTHNHARGQQFREFTYFMRRNVMGKDEAQIQGPPYKITFSTNSSQSSIRGVNFTTQIERVKREFSPDLVKVQAYEFKQLSLKQQVEIASESSIFVTVCGGGAVTATFLPPHASLLLYFDATGGAKNNLFTGKPARLDWDYFEHYSSLHTHWMPTGTMDSEDDLHLLIDVLTHELNRLQQERHDDRQYV